MKLALLSTLLGSALTDDPKSTDDKVWRSPIVFSGTCVKTNRSGKCGEITLWHIFKGDEQLTSTMVRTEKVDGFDQKQLFNLNADNSEAHKDETRIFFAEIDNGQVKLINKEENVFLDRLKRVTNVADFQKKNPDLTILEAIHAPLKPALDLSQSFEQDEKSVNEQVVKPEVVAPDSSDNSGSTDQSDSSPSSASIGSSSSDTVEPEVVEPEVETLVKPTKAPVVTDTPTTTSSTSTTTTSTTTTSTTKTTTTPTTTTSTTTSTTTTPKTTTTSTVTTTTSTTTSTTTEPVTVIDIRTVADNERAIGEPGNSDRSDYDNEPTLYPTIPPKGASTTYRPRGPIEENSPIVSSDSYISSSDSESPASSWEPLGPENDQGSLPSTDEDPLIYYPDEASGDYDSDDEDEDPLQRSARHKNMRFFANEDEWLNAINENEMDLIYRA